MFKTRQDNINYFITTASVVEYEQSFFFLQVRRARRSKARDRRLLFSGNVRNIPRVVQPLSFCQWFRLLTICFQCFKHKPIVSFCVVRATHNSFALAIEAVFLSSSLAAALVSQE